MAKVTEIKTVEEKYARVSASVYRVSHRNSIGGGTDCILIRQRLPHLKIVIIWARKSV